MERADQKTSEEFIMDSLAKAREDLDEVMQDLFQRGPVWDGVQLSQPATGIANILSTALEALASLDGISHIDGADLLAGLADESELGGWLEITRQLSPAPCDDPDCPDNTVGRSRR